jgi:hypothetical protein
MSEFVVQIRARIADAVSYFLFLVQAVPDSNVVSSYFSFLAQAVPEDEEGIKAWLQDRFGEAII